MERQDIIPGANFATAGYNGASPGRLIVPPYMGGTLYAAWALGTDFDPEPQRDISGNCRDLVFYGDQPGVTGFAAGTVINGGVPAYAEAPFSGADLLSVSGAATVCVFHETPTTSETLLFGDLTQLNVPGIAVIAQNDGHIDVTCINTGGVTAASSSPNATRGSSYQFVAGAFDPADQTLAIAGPGQQVSTVVTAQGFGAPTGGTQLCRIGPNAASNGFFGSTLVSLVVVYTKTLAAADFQTVRNWGKAILAVNNIPT